MFIEGPPVKILLCLNLAFTGLKNQVLLFLAEPRCVQHGWVSRDYAGEIQTIQVSQPPAVRKGYAINAWAIVGVEFNNRGAGFDDDRRPPAPIFDTNITDGQRESLV
jgi:hypothetical protein